MAFQKTIAVLGARGMLGSTLVRDFEKNGYQVQGFDRSRFDVLKDAPSTLPLAQAHCVVNAIGMINRRETIPGAADIFRKVNEEFPTALAAHCESLNVPVIHISTDCVFDGRKGPYTEKSETSATDLYGRSKARGEPANCMVIRSSIFGYEQENHYSLLSWFLAQKGECKGFTNHLWNGMSSLQLSQVIRTVLEKGLYKTGVHHVFSEDTTKYELLKLLADVLKRPVRVIPVEGPESRDTRLSTIYPDFYSKLGIPGLRVQIDRLRERDSATLQWSAT